MAVILTYAFPKKWESTDEVSVARANKINGVGVAAPNAVTRKEEGRLAESEKPAGESSDIEKNGMQIEPESSSQPSTVVPTGNAIIDFLEASHIAPMDPSEVRKATRLAYGFNILFLLVAVLIVPFTLFGSSWEFSRAGFTGFCVVSFMWVWVSMVICVIWPVVESWGTIVGISKGVVRDLGKGRKKGSEGSQSPPS